MQLKILLVENYLPLTRVLRSALEDEGHRVELVFELDKADSRAQSREHDVILLDLIRGQQSGLALLTAWRTNKLRTPVLVLRGPDLPREWERGRRPDNDTSIAVPFEFDELLARLTRLVQLAGHDSLDRPVLTRVLGAQS